jgi:hypothetical protein
MSTEISQLRLTSKLEHSAFERLVIGSLMASAIAAAVGIVFLILFFSGAGGFFGPLNDISVVIQYLLMLPIMSYIHRLLPSGQSIKLQVIGFGGVLAVIVLQTLLVIGLIPFQRQIVMVIPAFLVVTFWFAIIEQAGRDEPLLPKGRAQAILAGLVFGYPFWALHFRGRLTTNHSTKKISEEQIL